MKRAAAGELFLGAHHEDPVVVDGAVGQVVVVSRRGPGKTVNQDGALVLEHDGVLVLAVADGMGGHADGEQASRLALASLSTAVTQAIAEGDELRTGVLDGFEAAHDAVEALGTGAGTTLAVATIDHGTVRPIHAGDSTVLLCGQRASLKVQTVDHSPTGYALQAGLMDELTALDHPERHVLLSALGHSGLRIDVGPEQEIAARDTLLLASDGLTDNLTTGEIVERIRKGPLLEAARQLVALAEDRMAGLDDDLPGKPDDLTIVLFRRA
jgi:serine/threonine protein phosphatase PrpC